MDTEKRKKLFLLWISVLSISLLVLIIWIMNMRQELIKIREESNNNNTEEIEDLKDDFSSFFEKLNKEVNRIKGKVPSEEELEKDATNEDQVISTSSEENLVDNDNSVVENNDCPAYINCMPMIGETSSCVIPPGCEGITIPVY